MQSDRHGVPWGLIRALGVQHLENHCPVGFFPLSLDFPLFLFFIIYNMGESKVLVRIGIPLCLAVIRCGCLCVCVCVWAPAHMEAPLSGGVWV